MNDELMGDPCCERKQLKHEAINQAIAAIMDMERRIKKLKSRIKTPNEKEEAEVLPNITIEKPLEATLIESPKLINETLKKMSDHITSIERALF